MMGPHHEHEKAEAPEQVATTAAELQVRPPALWPSPQSMTSQEVIDLQRLVGNAAVAGMMRSHASKAQAPEARNDEHAGDASLVAPTPAVSSERGGTLLTAGGGDSGNVAVAPVLRDGPLKRERGQFRPGTVSDGHAIVQELARVPQQRRSGVAIQRQPIPELTTPHDRRIPHDLLICPNLAGLTDEELTERHDRIVQVLSAFNESTRDTAALEDQAAQIGAELGRRKALAAGRTFTDDAIKKMREYFADNAKTEKDSCIVALNEGMRIVTAQPTLPITPKSIEKTMAKIASAGHSSDVREVWFQSKRGGVTKGGARPEKLDKSIWDTIIELSDGDPGWSVFTMSLLDGYHSVTLTLDARDPSARRIYWSDQWQSKGGWKEYTRPALDAEVTALVQRWWDSQAEGQKHTTVVRLWRISATPTTSAAP